ncbi:family 10 glycosylhydrolase [Paenibacillus sp. N1-5-1-14]|uniref:family 10 glycosylhydrolase n=1 Tax=Paenibacillus radicibacter TaxID=2972488 RepID=UPI0021592DC0|nr:family 10 glycosylhydrolase [Paenibacillus radicibacter]MCR8642533.1 family 10 glycosylhydrolase [Paenibacillus radicibacter]
MALSKVKRKCIMLFVAFILMLGTLSPIYVSASKQALAETADDGSVMMEMDDPAVPAAIVEDEGSAFTMNALMAAIPSTIVEEFESTSTSVMVPSSAKANSVNLVLTNRPDPVQDGYHAVGLTYDFTGQLGTSAAYINLKDSNGSAGRSIEGLPRKIGMWVYGDGNNHWLRSQLQDATGTKLTVDFTSSIGLSWSGWKYVTAGVPSTMKTPIKLNQIYVVETKDNNKNAGTIYFDRLRAFYNDTNVYGLDLVGLTPLQVGESKAVQTYATYEGASAPTLLNGGVVYASSDPSVATVDGSGNVTALSAGTVTITADYGSAPQASVQLIVSTEPPIPQRLELAATSKLEVGQISKISTFASYVGTNEPVELTSGVNFLSSDLAVASIDGGGNVRALKAGISTITVSYGGVSKTYMLTVTNPVPILQKIELTGLSAMYVGESRQGKVMGTYTLMDAPVEITSGVTFTSSNSDVAAITSSGLLTAKKVGTTRIMASYGGKTSDFLVVVNNQVAAPKHEMRAAWIATVDNVDWPAKGVTNAEQQKRDYIKMLDDLESQGINAVIMQIKPTADAFYPSQYGPWSEWLTGVQGQDPGYNPLAFMIEEVHKRNMEFHAWFNPYRVSMQDQVGKLVDNHPAKQHPDWLISYGGKLYYNPGVPAARQFITDSVMEVVNGYDIDAVHFDDYFYPYPVSGVDFPDSEAFTAYGTGFANKADWRHYNVDTFIQNLSVQIKQAKPYVKFGISPFGIWKNKSSDPNGSDTNGLESYNALFADTRKWVTEEWIDYITPQVYWYFGYSPAAYEKVTDWWRAQVQGRKTQLYIGHAAYRIGAGDPAWMNPDEMPNQIAYNRNFSEIKGSIYFSAKSLQANLLGFSDRLKGQIYKNQALVPVMPWLDNTAPLQPVLNQAAATANGVQLRWSVEPSEDAAYYVVYRYEGNAAGSTDDPANILAKVRKQAGTAQSFVDHAAVAGQAYTYVITAVDRIHNESVASNSVTLSNIVDSTPPVTTPSLEGKQVNGWFSSDVVLTLQASDDGMGVDRTEVSQDGGETWLAYTTPITLTVEGKHTFAYRSIDLAGNIEAIKLLDISIDKTAPHIQVTGAGTYEVDQMIIITCQAQDVLSGVANSNCSTPLVQGFGYELELGTHEVTATATDVAGNTTSQNASYTIQVTNKSLVNLTERSVTGPGKQGIINSLLKKLEKGNYKAYINEVSAQKGKKIEAKQADLLIRLAQALQ